MTLFNRFFSLPVFRRTWAVGALGLTLLGTATVSQARDDVFWSVGVGAPGIAVGVSNAPPVYVQPAPVYVAPRPVYVAPRPVYYGPPPVVYRPAPVYYGPPGHHKHKHKGKWDHRRGKGHHHRR